MFSKQTKLTQAERLDLLTAFPGKVKENYTNRKNTNFLRYYSALQKKHILRFCIRRTKATEFTGKFNGTDSNRRTGRGSKDRYRRNG